MPEKKPSPTEHHSADDLVPARLRQFIPLLGVFGISIALVGFITGIREIRQGERVPAPALAGNADVRSAVTYSDIPRAKLGPNVHWEQTLADLKFDKPAIFDAVSRTEELKLAALADRAKNRAYDGAPPTIPHSIEALSMASCLVCHGEGLKVGDRIASQISHAWLTNCTQCHVEQKPAGLPNRNEPTLTEFVGLYRAGTGKRATPGAPPTIPHRTWMRENCQSCHGLVTRPGTRTTHPWLTNCTQCHASSATLNQLDFSEGER